MDRVTVVLPVGPTRPEEFVRDTVDSLVEFLPTARYVVIDDSGTQLGHRLGLSDATVLTRPDLPGRFGRLYGKLSAGFVEALREPSDLILRIDEDAVVLGNSFVGRAVEVFHEEPTVGLLGIFRRLYMGETRTHPYARLNLRRMVLGRQAVSDLRRAVRVGELLARARRYGYIAGDQVLSGVSLWNPLALRSLEAAGLLGDPRLIRSELSEDAIFGLCLSACGYAMQGFGSAQDDLPIAACWKGLPASPSELVLAGKELLHSTKSYAGRTESEVRATLRAARESRRLGTEAPRVLSN